MKLLILASVMYWSKNVNAFSFPGPEVYVVTPSPRTLQIGDGGTAPFYYHNWMRRMDTGLTTNASSTTVPPKLKTPDLIFAEFETDGNMQKSIRKLLEKEKITPKTTALKPIYVPDEETTKATQNFNYGLPTQGDDDNKNMKQNSYMLNNYYNRATAPVYLPSTTPSTTTTKTSTPTTTTTAPINIENIWHIIDNEKFQEQPGNWDEISLSANNEQETTNKKQTKVNQNTDNIGIENEDETNNADDEMKIGDDFALPGFSTNAGNGAENESRAIRTEPNLRFPYVNLKPFQMKTMKKPSQNVISNSKQNSNLFNHLDTFYDLKQPVRGEAQDVSEGQHIDRYNPAQPYLPKPDYGSKFSKQNSPVSSPPRASANLVPPPLPPRVSADDFPSPSSYESFPPYAPSMPNFSSGVPKPPLSTSVVAMSVPSIDTPIDTDSSDSSDSDDSPVMNLGYGYKPPSAPVPQFIPTIQPPTKSIEGYSYNKPRPSAELAPPVNQPDFQGYHYKKPEPSAQIDQMPEFQGYQYNKPESVPTMDKMPDFQGYHYKKPEPSPPMLDVPLYFDHKPSSYDAPAGTDHDYPHGNHDPDYPELIFNKHHDDSKGGDDMKGSDMGMMPPAPPADMKPDMHGPPDDHGFPSDFPGDLKYHHDIDDHDHYHYHHTTTTTTTEMPRVNRYSYYYLGKKLYYLPLYFSVYFIIYVGALIIKAVLRHKIVYPNSWRPNTTTASFFSKRSVDAYLSNDNLHELTGKVTHAIATAAKKYMTDKSKTK